MKKGLDPRAFFLQFGKIRRGGGELGKNLRFGTAYKFNLNEYLSICVTNILLSERQYQAFLDSIRQRRPETKKINTLCTSYNNKMAHRMALALLLHSLYS